MTFVEGQSGNPAGRRRGSRNKATLALEEMLEGGAGKITKQLLDFAWVGNPTAMRICADLLLPRRRFDLPRITSVADLPEACGAICDGLANGELNALEAERLTRMVERMGRILGPPARAARPGRASATNQQADAAAAPPAPPPPEPAPADKPPVSATNLQADAAADRPAPPPKSAAADDPPLAPATNLQAEEAGGRPQPPSESTAQPPQSATNLQANGGENPAVPVWGSREWYEIEWRKYEADPENYDGLARTVARLRREEAARRGP